MRRGKIMHFLLMLLVAFPIYWTKVVHWDMLDNRKNGPKRSLNLHRGMVAHSGNETEIHNDKDGQDTHASQTDLNIKYEEEEEEEDEKDDDNDHLHHIKMKYKGKGFKNLKDEKDDSGMIYKGAKYRHMAQLKEHAEGLDPATGLIYKRRRPKVYIIGQIKCGTGALSSFLSQHPSIVIHSRVELGFYNRPDYLKKGEQFHASFMPVSVQYQLGLENSPMYFRKKYALHHLARANKHAYYILIVREPVKRAVSEFVMFNSMKYKKSKNASRMFEEQAFLSNGSVNLEEHSPVTNGLYSKLLKQCHKYLPPHRIHVVDGNEFAKNPLPALQKIERFVKIENYFDARILVYNKNKRFYCLRNKGCLAPDKGRHHPEIDKKILSRLKQFFQPYNEEFFKLIGKRFNWQ